jgi:hypothetical protein
LSVLPGWLGSWLLGAYPVPGVSYLFLAAFIFVGRRLTFFTLIASNPQKRESDWPNPRRVVVLKRLFAMVVTIFFEVKTGALAAKRFAGGKARAQRESSGGPCQYTARRLGYARTTGLRTA